jgi:hypothetical protein
MPFNLLINNSKGAGQSMKTPKSPRTKTAPIRRALALKPNRSVRYDKDRAAAEKTRTKPRTIKSGLVLLFCPTAVPTKIGSKGKMQGAAMVKTPAKKAINICNIKILLIMTYTGTAVIGSLYFIVIHG